ncbi:MAG TPA: hypothetical protein VFK28_12400 [Sphingomicrobium sp.]|nr:hypothetical protein [Sphingomicrobium sp.]
MANYQKIIELRPEMADFMENRRKIALRGDVLTYWPNTRTGSFTTDSAGFRHSTFKGKTLSLSDCIHSDRYGIALGASNLFGFGVGGNENCMPSLFAERFGFPFANAAMPGANSRNLHSLLVGLIAGTKKPPAVVILSNGGDLAGFCESSLADPIFGSPNRAQLKSIRTSGDNADPEKNFPSLLAFSAMWTSAVARVCRLNRIPLVLVHQSTFFEKTKPTAIELECGLGEVFHPSQELQFANHRKFDEPFYANRRAFAENRGIAIAGAATDDIGFIDEFHCDKDGFRVVAKAVGDKVETVLDAKPPGGQVKEPAAATAAG